MPVKKAASGFFANKYWASNSFESPQVQVNIFLIEELCVVPIFLRGSSTESSCTENCMFFHSGRDEEGSLGN